MRKNSNLGSGNTREWTDLAELGLKIKPGKIFVNRHGQLLNMQTGKAPRTYTYPDGYERYQWDYRGKRYSIAVHRLVAAGYLDGYSKRKQIDHKDTNRANNDVSNLRSVTAKENARNPITYRRNLKNLRDRMQVSAYFFDGTLFKTFDNLKQAADELDLPKLTLQKTAIRVEGVKHCYGLLWKNTPYKKAAKTIERKFYELGKSRPAFMSVKTFDGKQYVANGYSAVANHIGASTYAVRKALETGEPCNGVHLSPITCREYWRMRNPKLFA